MVVSKILYFTYLSLSTLEMAACKLIGAFIYSLIYPTSLGNAIMVTICHHGTTLSVQALKAERAVAGWQQ